MKKPLTRFAVGFLLITTLFSCNKLIEAFFPGFDTDINAAEITIPAVPVVTSETPVGSVTFRFIHILFTGRKEQRNHQTGNQPSVFQ